MNVKNCIDTLIKQGGDFLHVEKILPLPASVKVI
jgi:hypothetical protein